MEELRHRVDEIVEDPATAETLKPWYGKHCKRVCFHDEYLPAFNRDERPPGRHRRAGCRGGHRRPAWWSPGSSTRVDVLVFASGFEVTTDLDHRLGFDPRVGAGSR